MVYIKSLMKTPNSSCFINRTSHSACMSKQFGIFSKTICTMFLTALFLPVFLFIRLHYTISHSKLFWSISSRTLLSCLEQLYNYKAKTPKLTNSVKNCFCLKYISGFILLFTIHACHVHKTLYFCKYKFSNMNDVNTVVWKFNLCNHRELVS